ncbi:ArsR/SmtB family transcription factor [Saccharopolyspora aridisoli]|uniref:ArsR/SmtB family transcription factor n=1 Tax=Saccharopolyspora aridisoli TaxID=2530385 RepID=UPI0038B67EF3
MSEHFEVLREAGLVEVRQGSQRRWYRPRPGPLAEIDSWLRPCRRGRTPTTKPDLTMINGHPVLAAARLGPPAWRGVEGGDRPRRALGVVPVARGSSPAPARARRCASTARRHPRPVRSWRPTNRRHPLLVVRRANRSAARPRRSHARPNRPVRALVIGHIGWSSSDIAPQRHQGSEA